MEEKKKVMIDAGHGGTKDPGAVFEDRMEKDDTLRLALAVGRILEENGVNAVYTRTTDVYDTPYQKAEMGNEAEADYFVSLHRNAASEPGKGSGVMTLVYKTGRESEQLADSIQRELARTGYVDLGVIERPDLIVLRKTQMHLQAQPAPSLAGTLLPLQADVSAPAPAYQLSITSYFLV